MLKANHPDGTEHLAAEVPYADFYVDDPHDIDWRCSVAGCDMAFVDAEKRVKHFRHLEEYGHENVPESLEHHYIKHQLQKYWKAQNYTSDVTVEAVIGDKIADLLLVLKSGETVVVEVQLSNQDEPTFKERTEYYNNRNFAVLWLVGEDNYINTTETKGGQGLVFSNSLKWLQKQYFGRFYLVRASKHGVEIEPTRLEKKMTYKKKWRCAVCDRPTGENYCHHCGAEDTYSQRYEFYYDKVGMPSMGEIPNREPFVPERTGEMDYKEYDIARFYDKKWWD